MRIPRLTQLFGSIWPWTHSKKDEEEPSSFQGHTTTSSPPKILVDGKSPRPLRKHFLKSHNLLVEAGALNEKLLSEHVHVYDNNRAIFEENDWETEELTNNTAKLINAGATPSQLRLYYDSIAYYKSCSCDTKRLNESFLELIETNPSSSEWEVYNDIVNYHINKGLHIDNLTSTFVTFINSKPQEEHLQVFKDAVALFKEKDRELHRLTHYFPYLVKAEASKNLLKTYIDTISYCIEKGWDIHNLTNNFIQLAKLKPTSEQIKAYEDAIPKYKEQGLGLEPLIPGFTESVKEGATPSQLGLYCNMVAYYLHSGWEVGETESFSKLIKARPNPKQWEIYKNAINQAKEQGVKLHEITNNFTVLVRRKLSRDKWEVINSAVDYSKEKKFGLPVLISAFSKLFHEGLSTDQLEYCNNAVEDYKKSGFDLGTLINGLADLFQLEASELLCEVYKNGLAFHRRIKQENNAEGKIAILSSYCNNLAELNPPQSMLKTYNTAVLNGHFKTIDDSINFLRDTVVHAAICNLIRSNQEESIKRTKNFISNFVTNDPVPYPQRDIFGNVNPDAQRVYSQTLRVYRRAFNIYHGFSSLTFETKRPPSKEPPLLARFGNDVAESVRYINARDINAFPGRGFVISKLNPRRIFVADSATEDPFHKYKTSWPWAKDVFNDLSTTHFIFTRGMIAVTCLDNDNYWLNDIDGKKVHYSYVVFNDHHHNYGGQVAFLVPTHILRKKLTGALVSYGDYVGFTNSLKDVNEVGLTPNDLIAEAKTIPANVLNLGWGSNIGGGLCNAYPLNSSPYHMWEKQRREEGETIDIYGRVHKSHITGDYLHQMTPKLDKLMIPLREAHDQVYDVTTKYQNLLDLFRLSLALWHKGGTIGEELTAEETSADYLFEDLEKPQYEQFLTSGEKEDFGLNPSSPRMLVEAYKWFKGREDGKNNKNDFPVLIAADALDWWTKPDSPFILDTYDMTLTVDQKKMQLPLDSNGNGIEEALIWDRYVIPHVRDFIKDLRFYDRRDLGIS